MPTAAAFSIDRLTDRALRRLVPDLLHRVAVRALLLREPRVGAEDARPPEDADVGRVDVLVGGEGDAAAVAGPARRIGHRADAEEIGRAEEREPVVVGETLPVAHLPGDRAERGIGDQRYVERRRQGHRRHSRNFLTASVTLWPPKPKLLLSATSTSRRTAALGG